MSAELGPEVAARLLDKLAEFSRSLDPDERALLGALLAPGVALALEEDEVTGFGAGASGVVAWRPDRLPAGLVASLRARGLAVIGLETGGSGSKGN